LAADDNNQVNACFSWRFLKTAKETHHFLGGSWKQPIKPIFFLTVRQNNQVNPSFAWRLA